MIDVCIAGLFHSRHVGEIPGHFSVGMVGVGSRLTNSFMLTLAHRIVRLGLAIFFTDFLLVLFIVNQIKKIFVLSTYDQRKKEA